jgi:hypothetical protein
MVAYQAAMVTAMTNPQYFVPAAQFGNRIGTQPTGYAIREMWRFLSGGP